MTSKATRARLNNISTGVPDSEIVCYVEIRGTFVFAGPQGATVRYSHGYEVFDARTGNLILGGGLN